MDLFEKCYAFKEADIAREQGYYPYFHPIESGQGTKIIIDGKEMINIGSNNYLGLTSHPKLKEYAINAIKKYGTGCTGSRFLNGTLDYHIKLEEKLADFMGREAALMFSTGYQTNLGTISALIGKDDEVYIDREDHASIVDGCRMSFGKIVKYKHNDYKDLERILEKNNKDCGKLIVVDGLYSMGGDFADLDNLVPVAKKYNMKIMVDEAHSMGVYGKHGRGVTEELGYEEEVDLVMGTFSKSFASIGGFIAGKYKIIDYIKHKARSLIFSASLPPASLGVIEGALEIIQNEPERRERLLKIAERMRNEYKNLGFNIGNSVSPVIPIIIGDDYKTFKFWMLLGEYGVYANPVVSPAVPPNMSLIRTSYTATHTDEELDRILEAMKKAGKEAGII
ncbi:MAG TPA: pyridoxal phosphate-dependent aminotransferase family protein [Candidatus Desulfofervidus auxilii]|uniref:Pyridoxal phosphate-dependent aminotransferase family protein n=1 Tax=Desulfofervidus auxilii TaxID=1621989 RepID=A0A7C0U259_DESA2|nr:pyridoxal phosphate-dependent aminotransferase family protein [Candidatus Desulfofervidus auxilii]